MSWRAWLSATGAQPGARLPEPAGSPPVTAKCHEDALALFAAGNYEGAARALSGLIDQHHDDARAHHQLGLAYSKLDRLEDAADSFIMALHFKPDFAEARLNLGLCCHRRGELASAAEHLSAAIALRPAYPEAFNAQGAVALERGDYAGAVAAFEHAILLKPDFGQAHSNLGFVLFRELGDYESGARHIRRALEINRGDYYAWCNYTMVLSHEGRLTELISACDQLLAAKPQLHEARLNRALASLKLGRFASAWPDYEARKQGRSNYIPRPFQFPEWQGEPLADKTILVYAEQGLGDEIMFSSCLPDLLRLGGRCVLDCSPRLARLFARSFPAVQVHASDQASTDTSWTAEVGAIDCQIAIGSLPAQFRCDERDFPMHPGYLKADQSRVFAWRERLNALGPGLKVGVSWRGGMASTRSTLRSTQLEDWLPVMSVPGCHFISVQYGNVDPELAAFRAAHEIPLHHWQREPQDLDETAALVAALDLVISVQTAVVHLGGALGRPVWVLVPAVPEWRYGQHGTTMPWYPSVRLFRQLSVHQWRDVMEQVRIELMSAVQRDT